MELHLCILLNLLLCRALLAQSWFDYAEDGARSAGVLLNGTLILGGLFPIHYAPKRSSSSLRCEGKFNLGGFEEAMAMLYALEELNSDATILPGISLGADLKDTCCSVDFSIRNSLNFSFIKNNIQAFSCSGNMRGTVAQPSATVGIIGPFISDVAMAITNLAGLFYVPIISYGASSRLLSNRNRFKYFLRTISSDTLMAKCAVDLLRALEWNFVNVLYSDTDYGRSAVETFEYVLRATGIEMKTCVAVKRALSMHSSEVDLHEILNEFRRAQNTKAKAVLMFTTMTDTELIMRSFFTAGMTNYMFISTDYFTGSIERFNIPPEMLRRLVGINPHKTFLPNFLDYFEKSVLNKTTQHPWLEEYKSYFRNKGNDSCQHSPYVAYVVDAVFAMARGLHKLLNCTPAGCPISTRDIPRLNRENDGLLKSIQSANFKGVSRDMVSFDSSGNSLGAYDITMVNIQTRRWEKVGAWKSNESDITQISDNITFLDLNTTKMKLFWRHVFGKDGVPSSVCGSKCSTGFWMKVNDQHQACCWSCVPCSGKEISNTPVSTSCKPCPSRFWPNSNHTACEPIIPVSTRLWDPPGAAVAVVASAGMAATLFVLVIFSRHRNTHLVRASSRTVSYIMLGGILLGYATSVIIFAEKTEVMCTAILYLFSVSFCVVVGALLTKTNRIHRIFSKRVMQRGTPPCLSDRWMVLFISCFVAMEIAICTIIVLTIPGGSMVDVQYSEIRNEASVQCTFSRHSQLHIALWWCYNTGIVLVCTYQAYLTRKVPGNYNEARFITFNMITISTDVLVFFLAYYGTGSYKDVLVAAFLTVADTVTLCCLFLPKVYIIMFRPEKNVAYRRTAMGTIEEDKGTRKTSGKSNALYLSSTSFHSNNSKPEQSDGQRNRQAPSSSHKLCEDEEGNSNNESFNELEGCQRARNSGEDHHPRKTRFRDEGAERLAVLYEHGAGSEVERSDVQHLSVMN